MPKRVAARIAYSCAYLFVQTNQRLDIAPVNRQDKRNLLHRRNALNPARLRGNPKSDILPLSIAHKKAREVEFTAGVR